MDVILGQYTHIDTGLNQNDETGSINPDLTFHKSI